MKSIKSKLINLLLYMLIGGLLIFIIESAVIFSIRQAFDVTAWGEPLFWQIYGILVVLGIMLLIIRAMNTWEVGRVLDVNINLDDSRWLTINDVKRSDNLTITTLKKLNKGKVKTGVPVYAKAYSKKDVHVIFAQPSHVLIIGTTGSGKTSGYLEPTIELLSRTSEKPSMIISDPKGELYAHRAERLASKGYEIKKLDLSAPYTSAKWNPFSLIIALCDEIKNATIEETDGAWFFNGLRYVSEGEVLTEQRVYVQERKDKIYEDMRDIIDTMCPVESKTDPSWEKTSRDFILACALVLTEEYIQGNIERKQFCLHNLYVNVLKYTTSHVKEMKEYFLKNENTQIKGLASPVVVAEGKTLTSYLSEITKHMSWLSDTGIASLTSETELSLGTFDETPTALFVIVPDEKESRNKLVTLFITQAYKELVAKAKRNVERNTTQEQELLRTTYFLLDEFGNLPKFPTIDKIITVGRSRRIFMQAVIQDYAQLENKYGKEVASIIKSNCNIKIFIGSNDSSTLKEWSELCGKTKVRSYSYGSGRSDNVNVSATERPLIHTSELQRLNDPPKIMGNAIVLAFGKYPLKGVFTPIFKTRAYDIDTAHVEGNALIQMEKRYFNSELYERDIFFCATPKTQPESTSKQSVVEPTMAQADTPTEAKEEPQDTKNEADSRQLYIQEQYELRAMYQKIDEQLAKYEASLSEADFIYLRQADFGEKITRLQELAKKAMDEGKRVLGLDLQKTATLLEAQFGERIAELGG